MPYATNSGVSRADMSADPTWIEIDDEQYSQALAGMAAGKLVSIEGGFALVDPPKPEDPPAPEPTLAELRESKQAAATAKRWEVMTGGITLPSGVVVGTTIDDQNRITSVVANAALAGLSDTDEVDFKAASGWVRITIGDIKQIAGAIGQFVQDCYTAERAHHDAIAALPDDRAAIEAYDVSVDWPA